MNAREVYTSIEHAIKQKQELEAIEEEKRRQEIYQTFTVQLKEFVDEMVANRVFYEVMKLPWIHEKRRDVYEKVISEVLINDPPYFYDTKLLIYDTGGGYSRLRITIVKK
jgi:hypothetical protein